MTAESGADTPMATGQSVLLAENSAATVLLIRTLLTRWGFGVQVTRCDATASRLLEEQRFVLAVIGATESAAAMLTADCVSAGLPVLALTTEGLRLEGATAELRLPVNAVSLKDAVNRCLTRSDSELDPDAIALLWESSDNPIYHRIARVFIGELGTRLARIAEGIAAGDLKAVEIEAHSIKGASGNVAAHAVCDAAARLEEAAARGNVGVLPVLAGALRVAAERGIVALERLFATGTGKP